MSQKIILPLAIAVGLVGFMTWGSVDDDRATEANTINQSLEALAKEVENNACPSEKKIATLLCFLFNETIMSGKGLEDGLIIVRESTIECSSCTADPVLRRASGVFAKVSRNENLTNEVRAISVALLVKISTMDDFMNICTTKDDCQESLKRVLHYAAISELPRARVLISLLRTKLVEASKIDLNGQILSWRNLLSMGLVSSSPRLVLDTLEMINLFAKRDIQLLSDELREIDRIGLTTSSENFDFETTFQAYFPDADAVKPARPTIEQSPLLWLEASNMSREMLAIT